MKILFLLSYVFLGFFTHSLNAMTATKPKERKKNYYQATQLEIKLSSPEYALTYDDEFLFFFNERYYDYINNLIDKAKRDNTKISIHEDIILKIPLKGGSFFYVLKNNNQIQINKHIFIDSSDQKQYH